MVNGVYINRNKDGTYNPYRNGNMNIIVQDMEMILGEKT